MEFFREYRKRAERRLRSWSAALLPKHYPHLFALLLAVILRLRSAHFTASAPLPKNLRVIQKDGKEGEASESHQSHECRGLYSCDSRDSLALSSATHWEFLPNQQPRAVAWGSRNDTGFGDETMWVMLRLLRSTPRTQAFRSRVTTRQDLLCVSAPLRSTSVPQPAFKTSFKNGAVRLRLHFATSSGVPTATSSPPSSPASGPISTT